MVIPAKSWKPSLVSSPRVILLMSTTIISSAAAGAAKQDMKVVAIKNLHMLSL